MSSAHFAPCMWTVVSGGRHVKLPSVFDVNHPYRTRIVQVIKSGRLRWAGQYHEWARGEVCTGLWWET